MAKKPLAYRGDEPFVFVSYAHADAELAYPLISGLQERGLRIWFDDGMDVGDLWDEVIPDHVEQCAAMLCLVSTRFTDSNNCLDEIHYAKEQKKELLILHLRDEVLPRNFRFRYGRFHALKLSDYSEQSSLLDKLAATQKLRCCLEEVKGASPVLVENPEEIFRKGKAFFEGRGVFQSYEEAVKWYRKAAEMGHTEAMCALGHCHAMGYGVSQSYKEAAMWYRQSAVKGDTKAMYNLGNCYFEGNGVSQSYEEAAMWYRRAADEGDMSAMNNLGHCYNYGKGVSRSYEEAVKWYLRAADKGNAAAMRNLANCYTYGWGVERDWKQVEYWRAKAKKAEAEAPK